ncbi:translation initiation factor IF-3 [Conexibacter sp. CPCC 206217]|uniref:translation initiation factor IF-3 n=1 Tax=Conexibacter sp. CPCC 206217 TaxID=3064574 RepID=UPI0027258CF3|nr:translation initiation factor IF-3 [Conexibacter sp. CPCC 206217]MDO8212845.1 translation initiation factor IF-3 [Conexibacter sp. CPCC 206217]
MPVPRRFDRRPPERDTTRINERIRVPEVRLIGEDGQQIGILKTPDALRYAQERDLDLVEVAADARPPVCRVLDYSKYRYEQAQKVKAAKKHQQQITIREIKFRPKIAQNDYDTKKGHVTRFLRHKDKVKVTIMFRGREVTHPERGSMLLERLAEELADIAVIEQRPIQDGRNMTMMLGPSKTVLAEAELAVSQSGQRRADPAANGKAEAPAARAAVSAEAAPRADAAAAETAPAAEARAEAARAAPAEARAEAARAAPARAEAARAAPAEARAEAARAAPAEARAEAARAAPARAAPRAAAARRAPVARAAAPARRPAARAAPARRAAARRAAPRGDEVPEGAPAASGS